MNITKFDLYNAEWLDLVFDHRNKEYGAYDLRKHYGSNMVKAMGLALAGVAVLVAASIIFRPKIDHTRIIEVVLPPPTLVEPPVKAELKKIEQPKHVEPAKAAPPVSTTRFVIPVIVANAPTEEPPVIKDLTGAIGPETIKGPAGGDNVIKTERGDGNGTAPPDNTTIVDVSGGGLEVMPEPVGGAAAWSKFLQKNLRYPPVAQEQEKSGRVFLSFVIETDGQLSNIKVERGAGYGFDEEALRVLKLAKAWKPGIQNGRPVRVRYTIPINFQLSEQ
ncbi:MAG: TonB family protein [Mucilaginibacter sp.]|nr:TonB family protein [Mucilaginibacter sp.]